ncbi:glutathione S-transferase family protein [Methylocapsa sp. S129]|uniref:glutathione S-transferase family protein n=1 Tax=Methylocapsa sp. S129 TaxID=1641869 RepID=UPI00131B8B41|nr:glutathione S-transferase family protein [Methylocapsa sp. S129]
MRIFGDLGSGNCQKVKLTADYLRLPYEWIAVDTMKGETRTSAFLARNPFGQIPVVEFADGRHLAQSNAIVRFLARDSTLIPEDDFELAKADELMFWEQYSHEPYVAVARFQMVYLGKSEAEREARLVERGDKALDLMERLLTGRQYFVGDRLSVADISLLPYTRLAHEGGFDLMPRKSVRAWIARCEQDLRLS